MFTFAIRNYTWLKNIDANITFKEENREPLEPMIDTLRQYCSDCPDGSFNVDVCLSKLPSKDNVYRDIFYYIVYLFLKMSEKKRRCLCLHGVANSGKTTIAKFLKKIFTSHDYRTTHSVFQ